MYIAAVSVGHDACVTLLKDGQIVFSIAEERVTRRKHDSHPLTAMMKIKEYTDTIDVLALANTNVSVKNMEPTLYFQENQYVSWAMKLGLIERNTCPQEYDHPQVMDLGLMHHHKLHAMCAYINSGFDECCAVVMDGAGSFMVENFDDPFPQRTFVESESIFEVNKNGIQSVLRRFGSTKITSLEIKGSIDKNIVGEQSDTEFGSTFDPGPGKMFEAVAYFSEMGQNESGKVMGLAPYGERTDLVDRIMKVYQHDPELFIGNKDLFDVDYPAWAHVKPESLGKEYYKIDKQKLSASERWENKDIQNLCYAVQEASQQIALSFIKKAIKETGKKKVILSGGYFLNCVCNYWLLDQLDDDVELYVEPASNDSGISLGMAYFAHAIATGNAPLRKEPINNIYFGLPYKDELKNLKQEISSKVKWEYDVTHDDVIKLITEGNIVAMYQGRSEHGPRALGNRSILFDPRVKNGKDIVNGVKGREWYRPFAGTILVEHFADWFETRGLDESPFMMYAMKCRDEKQELIPSIVHVDGTCRIQTVSQEQNPNYYALIERFYEKTGVPILFNTSFNLAGEAMVETIEDAINTIWNSNIEYLYLPEHNMIAFSKN